MISIIVAYAKHRVIGKEGKMPWHLPSDLKHFKTVTSGHTVVMGRKTLESIGRPLPNRRNVVLSRNPDLRLPGVEVVHTKNDVLNLGDVFIIGGEELFRLFLAEADRLYVTEIDVQTEGDTFFPEWNPVDYHLIASVEGVLDEKNTLPHTFYTYDRKKL